MSACEHGGALVVKFDGGRQSVLCDECRAILGSLDPQQWMFACNEHSEITRLQGKVDRYREYIEGWQRENAYLGDKLREIKTERDTHREVAESMTKQWEQAKAARDEAQMEYADALREIDYWRDRARKAEAAPGIKPTYPEVPINPYRS